MEELTIEQKAKAYDEAIKRAKELLEIGVKDTRDKRVVLSFFPELAESEDEKIKEALIKYFSEGVEYLSLIPYNKEQCVAWLENQGEKRSGCSLMEAWKDMRFINWLKSLRPQNRWKPSEKQKEALLWCVVHLGGSDKQTLGELLEELNKL